MEYKKEYFMNFNRRSFKVEIDRKNNVWIAYEQTAYGWKRMSLMTEADERRMPRALSRFATKCLYAEN